MKISDYDQALFYTHRLACDELIHVMQRTEDDFLAKKIERFIRAFLCEEELEKAEEKREELMNYLDHVYRENAGITEIYLL